MKPISMIDEMRVNRITDLDCIMGNCADLSWRYNSRVWREFQLYYESTPESRAMESDQWGGFYIGSYEDTALDRSNLAFLQEELKPYERHGLVYFISVPYSTIVLFPVKHMDGRYTKIAHVMADLLARYNQYMSWDDDRLSQIEYDDFIALVKDATSYVAYNYEIDDESVLIDRVLEELRDHPHGFDIRYDEIRETAITIAQELKGE